MLTSLPQLSGDRVFLTDGGLETSMIFHRGLDLPLFASYKLLEDGQGRAALRDYFARYLEVARERGAGFILDTATWRSNPDWGARLGDDAAALDAVNRAAVELALEIRDQHGPTAAPVLVNGVVGPRGDGYVVEDAMTAADAEAYHAAQVRSFAAAGADMVSAITMTYAEEATGIARRGRRGSDARRDLVHGRDRRAAAERPGARRRDRASGRRDRRVGRVLHGQLRAPA